MPSFFGLDPDLRDTAEELLAMAREADPRFRLTSVVRGIHEQQKLWDAYQEALRRGEAHLPAARPGTSKHEFGLAFDMARPGIAPEDDDLLPELGAIWEEAGGIWGGRFNDPVHFESPKTIAEAQAERAEQGLAPGRTIGKVVSAGAHLLWEQLWPF